MPISLYDATVARFAQTLGAVDSILEKGESWCSEHNVPLDEVVEQRLIDDMRPFHFQIVSVWHHSLGAVKGVEAGEFSPPPALEKDYAGLRELVKEAQSGLAAYTPADIEGLIGRDVVFKLGDQRMPFVAEDFLFTFSMPNFFFHATTTYDMLRQRGVPLGKRDFLGRMKLKSS